MSKTVLQVENLTTKVCIGKEQYSVVDRVSFSIKEGQVLALVGESGSGKSLTALSLMRLLPTPPMLPSEGKVLFQGENLLSFSERQMRRVRGKRIAMIFQDPMSALNPVYSIGNQLVEVAETHLGLYGNEATACAISALTEVGIPAAPERMEEYPHQLSGGMRQRVMIAMALMCEPDVLIADEPTTALDVTIQAQVLDLIRTLQKKKKMAILLITHDMGVVAEVADEVMVMYASRIIERGKVDTIFDYMAHPYTQALFASRPTLRETHKGLEVIRGQVPVLNQMPSGCRFHPRCSHVMEKCRRGQVPWFCMNEGEVEHKAACWLRESEGKREGDDVSTGS